MSFSTSFFEALAEYVRSVGYDVAEVTNFSEEVRESGFCETCYYSETVVEITFIDTSGLTQEHTYYGDMAEFIRDLTNGEAA